MGEARPWLIQDVPELTKDSQADICFKGEGLCVIFLTDGVAPAADVDMLAGMKSKFTPPAGRPRNNVQVDVDGYGCRDRVQDALQPGRPPERRSLQPAQAVTFYEVGGGYEGECAEHPQLDRQDPGRRCA